MITFNELCERLEKEEETILLEKLNILSYEIVERYHDKIEERYESLIEEYTNDEEEGEGEYADRA